MDINQILKDEKTFELLINFKVLVIKSQKNKTKLSQVWIVFLMIVFINLKMEI